VTADEIRRLLALEPHPEGGFYRETFRAPAAAGVRSPGSAIYFLLTAGKPARWHRVDADEIWHWYAGAPLLLEVSQGAAPVAHRLGPDLAADERPQRLVPGGAWQSARTCGDWTLVGCTVSPAFEFEAFELAPPGFRPE